jgi:two-component system response regulator YesN
MYTIFLVEDEPICLYGIESILKTLRPQCNVHALANVESALQKLAEVCCDVLITDIRMPGKSGLDLIEAFHAKGMFPVCAIISAYNDFPYMQRALRLDVHDYILKPADEDALSDLLNRLEQKITKLREPICEEDASKQIKDYIEQNYANPSLDLNLLAEHFRFSPSYMSTWFKCKMDENFLTYLNKVRMSQAATLLIQGARVNEAATAVGFTDAKYFARVFKLHFSVTPGTYRHLYRPKA